MNDHTERHEAGREPHEPARQKLGDPPTAEEMHAYFAGTLGEEEAERIQDYLAEDPDLARAYSAPMPEAPRPGDADFVAEEKITESWNRLQTRLGRNIAVMPRKRWSPLQWIPSAVAAALAAVSLVLYQNVQRLEMLVLREPVLMENAQRLHADLRRGGGEPKLLHPTGNVFALKLQPDAGLDAPQYRIEILRLEDDATKVTRVFDRSGIQLDRHGEIGILVPRQLLPQGDYRIDVSGIDGRTNTPISSFFVRSPAE
jgi:hypothetical protein